MHSPSVHGHKIVKTYSSQPTEGELVNVDLDIKVSRSYESSVFRPDPDQGLPFGDRNYILVIDGYIRIPISQEQAESLVEYAQVKKSREVRDNGPIGQTLRKIENSYYQHPAGAAFFSNGEAPIPDPLEEDDAEEEEDDSGDEDYTGIDDAGDGVGQF